MVEPDNNPLVLVTGSTGYVGLHLVQLLLRNHYNVRGTVRDQLNETKMNPLKEVWKANTSSPLNVIETDLLKDEGWDEAVRGCMYVFHVASPFPIRQPSHEDDLIKPAVEGTRRVLEACSLEAEKGSLKRVVLTSSIGAIHGETSLEEGRIYNENDWTDAESPHTEPYVKSKTLAEKLAWEIVGKLPVNRRFELAVVNGSYAIGPVLSNVISAGSEMIYRLMDVRRLPLLPELSIPLCDVRDFAEAHLKAMIVPEAAGHRHIVAKNELWVKEIALILVEEFGNQGYNIPTRYAPYAVLWLASMFDETIKMTMHRYYKKFIYRSKRAEEVLGIQQRDCRRSIIDSVHSLIKYGIIKKTKKYQEPDYDFQN